MKLHELEGHTDTHILEQHLSTLRPEIDTAVISTGVKAQLRGRLDVIAKRVANHKKQLLQQLIDRGTLDAQSC